MESITVVSNEVTDHGICVFFAFLMLANPDVAPSIPSLHSLPFAFIAHTASLQPPNLYTTHIRRWLSFEGAVRLLLGVTL